jgi:hypothetical protein
MPSPALFLLPFLVPFVVDRTSRIAVALGFYHEGHEDHEGLKRWRQRD